MTDLSPAAQAVDFAVHGPSPYATRRQIAAAALQAAADQVLIRPGIPSSEYSLLMQMIDRNFRAIAAELETTND